MKSKIFALTLSLSFGALSSAYAANLEHITVVKKDASIVKNVAASTKPVLSDLNRARVTPLDILINENKSSAKPSLEERRALAALNRSTSTKVVPSNKLGNFLQNLFGG